MAWKKPRAVGHHWPLDIDWRLYGMNAIPPSHTVGGVLVCMCVCVCVRLWGRSCGGVRATSWNLLHSCIMEADANPSQKSEQNYWETVSTMLGTILCLPRFLPFGCVALSFVRPWSGGLAGDWAMIVYWIEFESHPNAVVVGVVAGAGVASKRHLMPSWHTKGNLFEKAIDWRRRRQLEQRWHWRNHQPDDVWDVEQKEQE